MAPFVDMEKTGRGPILGGKVMEFSLDHVQFKGAVRHPGGAAG